MTIERMNDTRYKAGRCIGFTNVGRFGVGRRIVAQLGHRALTVGPVFDYGKAWHEGRLTA